MTDPTVVMPKPGRGRHSTILFHQTEPPFLLFCPDSEGSPLDVMVIAS